MRLERRADIVRQAAARGEVRAARKAAARPGEQQAARALAGQRFDRLAQLVEHRRLERVQGVGAIERDRRDGIVAQRDVDMFESHDAVVTRAESYA